MDDEKTGHLQAPTRRTVLTGLAAGAAITAMSQPASASTWTKRPPLATRQRERVLLSDRWRFAKGDPSGASGVGFEDGAWSNVTVPHTWNVQDANDDTNGYYQGPGWYRTTLQMQQQYAGKRLFLYFEGANQVADVYVEGAHVGHHVGGYQAFSMEITEQVAAVEPGGSATLAVRVDNSYNRDIPPLSADFTFYGGIYRNVWLVVTEPVHLDLLDHASSGVYVDTPLASARAAVVRVRSRVRNDLDVESTVTLRNVVLDADGQTVVQQKSRVRLAAGEVKEVVDTLPAINRPRLWSPDSLSVHGGHHRGRRSGSGPGRLATGYPMVLSQRRHRVPPQWSAVPASRREPASGPSGQGERPDR